MIYRKFIPDDINKGLIETYKEVWQITEINEKTLWDYMHNDNIMYVVEEDGKIIATATLHLQRKLIRNGGVAGLIEDVAVREAYRGNGIGGNLIKILIDEAMVAGCYKVILSCYPERVDFYKRCGFKQESITMRYYL